MMHCNRKNIALLLTMLCPFAVSAQESWADKVTSLQSVLATLYTDMLPLCSQLIGVGRSIAGFAATWYIAARIWGHITRAEAIDFYPLFRPFVIGFAILIFPSVIALMNGILEPTVMGTSAIVRHSDASIAALLAQKEKAIRHTDAWDMYVGPSGEGDSDQWYRYTHPEDPDRSGEGLFEGLGNEVKFAMAKAGYNFRNSIKEVLAEILQLLFAAVALCINTLRTFNLLLLAILGPLVFGLSVFDGFQHTLRQWISRYVNVFLWLPVANIFGAIIGKIQEQMLAIDITQINEQGDTFFSRTDAGYMIFLLIGIVGYITVPHVASYIMWAGGSALNHKVSSLAMSTVAGTAGTVASAGTAGVHQVGQGVQNVIGAPGQLIGGYHEGSSSNGIAAHLGHAAGQGENYLRQKLSGKPGE